MHPNKKSRLSLDKPQEKLSALSERRPEAEAKSEKRPGFIGPQLPAPADAGADAPPTSSPPQPAADDSGPKKRFLDGAVKPPPALGGEGKTNGKQKQATSLVPYDEDSSSSESSLSPAPVATPSLTAKATTPNDWQVTVSPSVRSSPSVSSEGSTKTNWNVTSRSSPNIRKSDACTSDPELDSNSGDNELSRAARSEEVPGVHKIPPTPAQLLNTNGLGEKYFKK